MKKTIISLLLVALMLSMAACAEQTVTTPTTTPTNAPEATSPATQAPATEPPVTEAPKSEAAIAVEGLISAIGDVVAGGENDSLEAITAAEEAYKALSAEEKAQVENADVLTAARETYDQLACAQEAAAVVDLIGQIGEVSTSKTEQIRKAIAQYNALSADAKKHVENIDVLKSAASTLADKLLAKLTCDEDFVRGYNFYYPDAFPWGETYWYADQGCFVLPYLGTSSNDAWLRLVCNLNCYDWIFFTKITVAADDARFYDYFNYFDVVRDNDGGEIWEYVDIDVGASEIEMLWAIANSTKTVVRFEGDDYYYDYTVTDSQKASIRDMLIVYELLDF